MVNFRLIVAIFAFVAFGVSQQLSSHVTPQRDVAKENQVAKLFVQAEKSAGHKVLNRIEYRKILQETLCTAALMDKVTVWDDPSFVALPGDSGSSPVRGIILKRSDPADIAADLNRVLSFDAASHGYTRFSTAVWTTKSSGEPQYYWIALQLYPDEVREFIARNFTDYLSYRHEIAKQIAPECKQR